MYTYVTMYIMHKYHVAIIIYCNFYIIQILEPETLKNPHQPQLPASSDEVHPTGKIIVATMIIT